MGATPAACTPSMRGTARGHAQRFHFGETLGDAGDGAAVADAADDPTGRVVGTLLGQFQPAGLLALDQVRIDRAVAVVPAQRGARFAAQRVRLGVGALDAKHRGAVREQLGQLALRHLSWHEDVRADAGDGGAVREARRGVAGRGAGQRRAVLLHGPRHGDRAGAVFERVGCAATFILETQTAYAQRLCQARRLQHRRPADLWNRRMVRIVHRQKLAVAPACGGGPPATIGSASRPPSRSRSGRRECPHPARTSDT